MTKAVISGLTFFVACLVYFSLMQESTVHESVSVTGDEGSLNVSNASIMVIAEEGSLIFRAKENGIWSNDFFLSDETSNSATPAFTKDKNGDIWVLWSEANAEGAELRYRTFSKSDNKWGVTNTFNTGFSHNSTPALLTDNDGKLWVFWAAVDGEDDEIYYSQFEAGSWQQPQLVVADNKVPDIGPVASLSVNGDPEIDWQTFDRTTLKYRNTAARWQNGKWQPLGFRPLNPLKAGNQISDTQFLKGS